ncbi:MAG: MBL fold metallo-hydrolase [Haloarculaceae archaeon]
MADVDPPSVTPARLQERIDAGDPVRVLDLRNRDEVERWRLSGPSVTVSQKPNARFIQARVTDSVEQFVADVDGEGPITAVCARGEASADVAATLVERGYDARNLAGGMEAWARLLTATEIADGATESASPGDASGSGATVVQYRRPASGCLGYAVYAGGEAAVVDPLRAFADRYVADARERGASIEYAVDTHVHADHLSGVRALAGATGAEPVLPAAAADRGATFDVTTVTDGDALAVGDSNLTAVAAPGHTTGMTAFAVGDVLLTGDSLFVESVARPDLERGADGARALARDLYRTLTERFARFPDRTLVAPGHHGDGATPDGDGACVARLGDLRGTRPFSMSEAAFVDYVTGDMPPRPANFERIIAVNLGRESVDADEAFELELGPNNCAAAAAPE